MYVDSCICELYIEIIYNIGARTAYMLFIYLGIKYFEVQINVYR